MNLVRSGPRRPNAGPDVRPAFSFEGATLVARSARDHEGDEGAEQAQDQYDEFFSAPGLFHGVLLNLSLSLKLVPNYALYKEDEVYFVTFNGGRMTEDEMVAFLKRHRIKAEEIFNAKGLRRMEYAELMKKNSKLFAINTDACSNGHRLRTHSGHCVVCDSSSIHHYRLHYRTSFVYVAGSKSKRALKIGTSDDPNDRMRRLNGEGYGGAYDWVLLIDAWTEEAGRKEKEIQSALRRFFVKGEYIKSGKNVSTYELVSCGLSTARNVMREVLSSDENPKFSSKLQATLAQYEFDS